MDDRNLVAVAEQAVLEGATCPYRSRKIVVRQGRHCGRRLAAEYESKAQNHKEDD